MKNMSLFFLTSGIVLLVSCNRQKTISEEKKNAITETVKECVAGYADAVKRRDTEWLLDFWSNEKDFAIAGDGELIADYESGIAKPTRDFISGLKDVLHFDFSDGQAWIIDEHAVSYITNYDWGVVLSSGDTIKSKGSWLYVFRKSDETWKVVHSAGTRTYY